MIDGVDKDVLVKWLKWESWSAMPPEKARAFARFLDRQAPPQHALPLVPLRDGEAVG